MISMKVYRTNNDVLVAACDSNLIGKKFYEGKLKLEISKEFYENIVVGEEAFLQQLSFATIANLVGEHVISKAIEAGVVNKDCVIKIDGIPHAQVAVLE